MSECVELEREDISRVVSNLILSRQALQSPRNVSFNKRISVEETLGGATSLVLGCGKKPLLRIFFRRVRVFDPLNLCKNNSSHFRSDGNTVPQNSCFLVIPRRTALAACRCQARISFGTNA